MSLVDASKEINLLQQLQQLQAQATQIAQAIALAEFLGYDKKKKQDCADALKDINKSITEIQTKVDNIQVQSGGAKKKKGSKAGSKKKTNSKKKKTSSKKKAKKN